MTFSVQLTVVVTANDHAAAMRKLQDAIEGDKSKTSAYIETIDKVKQQK